MPDRIIRDELTHSERYWALGAGAEGEPTPAGDTLRLLFRHLLNEADDFGNAEAGTVALSSIMNRPVSLALAEKWRAELSTVDLVRPYKVGVKWYVHIPRFRQRLRALKGKHPRPPPEIECNELKDLISGNASHKPDTRQSADVQTPDTSQTPASSRAPAEEKGSEEKGRERKGSEGAGVMHRAAPDAASAPPVEKALETPKTDAQADVVQMPTGIAEQLANFGKVHAIPTERHRSKDEQLAWLAAQQQAAKA